MKKVTIILILAFLIFKANAQTFENNFLGEDFLRYKGVYLKVKEDATSSLSYAFYGNLKYCQSSFNNNVIYPDTKDNYITIKDSLVNRIFVVDNIVDRNGKSISDSNEVLYNPIFILKDTTTNKIIYYLYDKSNEFNFPFITSPIPKKDLCSLIIRDVDDFTDEISLRSPYSNDNLQMYPMAIIKTISKTKTTYYLSLLAIGQTVSLFEKGVIILFDDGTKWTKPNEIDVEATENGFEYRAFITLSLADLTTFSTKKIKKYRLYVYDKEVNSNDADNFKIYTKCIKEAK
jgi:hypothetical protein